MEEALSSFREHNGGGGVAKSKNVDLECEGHWGSSACAWSKLKHGI